MENGTSRMHAILNKHSDKILAEWTTDLSGSFENDRRISESELSSQSREFLKLVEAALGSEGGVESAHGRPCGNFLRAFRVRAHSRDLPRTKLRHSSFRSRNRFSSICERSSAKIPRYCRRDVERDRISRQARSAYRQEVSKSARGDHQPPAGRTAGAINAGGEVLGWHSGAADDWHSRQRTYSDRDGIAVAANCRYRFRNRDYRYYRRADRRYAYRAASA